MASHFFGLFAFQLAFFLGRESTLFFIFFFTWFPALALFSAGRERTRGNEIDIRPCLKRFTSSDDALNVRSERSGRFVSGQIGQSLALRLRIVIFVEIVAGEE